LYIQAVAAGDEGATAESGPWLITLDMPRYVLIGVVSVFI
jgi:hypothetical protein